MSGLGNGISEGLGALGDIFTGGMKSIGEAVSAIPDLISSCVNVLGNILESVGRGFTSIFNKLADVCASITTAISNAVTALVDAFTEALKLLFVPSYNPASDVNQKINSKFPFIEQIKTITSGLFKDFKGATAPPSFTITYQGGTYDIINFSFIAPYRSLIHGIITAILWVQFILWLVKFAPKLLKGGG